jgi:carboxyl-terminal processing protease
VSVVDLFAASGLIVQTRGRDGAILEAHHASPNPAFGHLKTVVLIDGDSASASEIVAGALRALCSASLVGTDSYGKWSVQRLYVFETKSAIKLTIARYEIADQDAGTDQVGLKPDLLVQRPTASTQAHAALVDLLSANPAALEHLSTLARAIKEDAPRRDPAPLDERLILDPQLKAAWTLARNSH